MSKFVLSKKLVGITKRGLDIGNMLCEKLSEFYPDEPADISLPYFGNEPNQWHLDKEINRDGNYIINQYNAYSTAHAYWELDGISVEYCPGVICRFGPIYFDVDEWVTGVHGFDMCDLSLHIVEMYKRYSAVYSNHIPALTALKPILPYIGDSLIFI
jgi:hypothetical protein